MADAVTRSHHARAYQRLLDWVDITGECARASTARELASDGDQPMRGHTIVRSTI